jgi:hypothetical protein
MRLGVRPATAEPIAGAEGGGLNGVAHADIAASIWLVFNVELLVETVRQLFRDQTCEYIVRSAWSYSNGAVWTFCARTAVVNSTQVAATSAQPRATAIGEWLLLSCDPFVSPFVSALGGTSIR